MSGLLFPCNFLFKTIRKLLRKFRSLRPPVCSEFLMKSNKEITPEASGVSGLQLPCNSLLKTIRFRPTPYILSMVSGASGLQFHCNALFKIIRKWVRKPPEASGLQFPQNSSLKTIRKLLRKPPERPACFFLTISY